MPSSDGMMLFIKEHLSYEILMLMFAFQKINSTQRETLEWNAFYECFAVHARTLAKFLRGKETNNYNARDFSQKFKSDEKGYNKNWLQMLECQVFHTGKKRPSDPSGKFNLESAIALHSWIYKNIKLFRESLDPATQDAFDNHFRDMVWVPEAGNSLTATNYITILSQSPENSGG